ncbi:hypothetical protein Lser_V15G44315 [Lactuca serriola]
MASNDPGWQYGIAVEGKGNQWVICTFCNKTTKGGITRHKHHLAGDSAQVLKCPRVPIEVQKVFKDAFDKKKQDKEAMKKIPHFDDDVVDIDEDEEATTNSEFFQSKGKRPMSSSGSTATTKRSVKGPLDVIWLPCDKTGKKKGYLVGTSEHKEIHKKLRLDAVQKICHWMYDAGIAFNVVKYDSFGPTLEAVALHGCGEYLFKLFDHYIKKTGPEDVVQIVTDSASNNVLAGRIVEEKYPHIYWTPCAAHCINLMLEDIFKLPHLKKTLDRAIAVNSYIYNRTLLLNMMRDFTAKEIWTNIDIAVKVGDPLLTVLRLVDSEKKSLLWDEDEDENDVRAYKDVVEKEMDDEPVYEELDDF